MSRVVLKASSSKGHEVVRFPSLKELAGMMPSFHKRATVRCGTTEGP